MISSKFSHLRLGAFGALVAAAALLSACGDDPVSPTAQTNPWPAEKKIHLISPVPGTVVKVGDVVHVKWETRTIDDVDAADIELSPDNGKTWGFYLDQHAITPADANWGDFAWTVTDSVTGGSKSANLVGNDKVLLRVLRYSTSDDALIHAMPGPMTVQAK